MAIAMERANRQITDSTFLVEHGLGDLTKRFVVADIAGAAANMRTDRLMDRLARDRRRSQSVEKNLGGHDEARRAIAALEREMAQERLLHGQKGASFRNPFDGDNADAVDRRQRGRTADDRGRGAIGRTGGGHRAGAADPDSAAELRSGQIELVVQEIDEPFVAPRFVDLMGQAVDDESDHGWASP